MRPIELLAQKSHLFRHRRSPKRRRSPRSTASAELEQRIEGYRRNRAALLERLPAAGLDRLAPVDGAFYLYADVAHLTDDSALLCRELLDATGVALTPGADFDSVAGHRFVRLAFAATPERVVVAGDRLAAWLRSRG